MDETFYSPDLQETLHFSVRQALLGRILAATGYLKGVSRPARLNDSVMCFLARLSLRS